MFIDCTESSYAVIFEGLDCPLSYVDTMIMGLNELDLHVLLFKVSLDRFARDIVNNVEHWPKSSLAQIRNVLLERLHNRLLLCIRNRGC